MEAELRTLRHPNGLPFDNRAGQFVEAIRCRTKYEQNSALRAPLTCSCIIAFLVTLVLTAA